MNEPQNKKHLNIEISEDVSEGVYVNLSIVGHSDSEFILDFIRVVPGIEKARVKSRIVMHPEQAKRFLNVMKDNIARYESTYGSIKTEKDNNDILINFGGPTGQA